MAKDSMRRAQSLLTRVHDSMDQFSAGERKVARALLANYPAAGLESATALAGAAHVSTPTVLRFTARLGYQGYPELQRQLIHEVHAQLGSPLAQLERSSGIKRAQDFLPYAAETFLTSVGESFDNLPRHDFTRAVDLLADRRRRVRLVGGRFSHVLADYLASHLQMVRADVMSVGPTGMSHASLVADAGRRDVLVAFDYRRYQEHVVSLAMSAADAGATIILMTDQYLSPISDVAEVVLPTRVDAPSAFDSLVPAMALVESLAAAVFDEIGEPGRRRMRTLEDANPDVRPASGPMA